MLMFVDTVDAAFSRLRRQNAGIFGYRTRDDITAIGGQFGAVRAWSNIETRSRDGDHIGANAALGTRNGTLAIPTASRLFAAIRRDMIASVVLVERRAVIGKTSQQIADYVAMRALADTHPRGPAGKDTILSLFDPGNNTPPAELTDFDRGYLKGLYSGSPNQLATMHSGRIVRTILGQPAARIPTGSGTTINSGGAARPVDPAPAPDPDGNVVANSPGSRDRAGPSHLPCGSI